jgi:hypothetical protein
VVIAEQFAWAHLPKAAGTATQQMLTAVPGLVVYASPTDSNDKHDPFTEHGPAVAGKLLVMNIRRLPSWALSYAHHKAVAGLWPRYEPLPMPSVEEMAEDGTPDEMLGWMTNDGEFEIDRWLRTESLTEDVLGLLSEVGALTRRARRGVERVPWVGKPYDHKVESTFGPEQVRRMYERNPLWAEVERRVYGGVLELAPA